MDNVDPEDGQLDHGLPGSGSSVRRDVQLDSPAATTGLTIVAADQYEDPLAEFASEPGEQTAAAPVEHYEAVPPSVLRENAPRRSFEDNVPPVIHSDVAPPPSAEVAPRHSDGYPDLPLITDLAPTYRPYPSPPLRGHGSWAALVLIGVAVAAFGTGAYLYEMPPSWLVRNTPSPPSVPPPSDDAQRGQVHVTEVQVAHDDQSEVAAATPPLAAPQPAAAAGTVARDSTGASKPPTARSKKPTSAPPAAARNDTAMAEAEPRALASDSRVAEADSSSLSGEWSMNTRVESSGLDRYEGLRLAYHLRLQQVGKQVTGAGYKVRENDRAVGTQTPITLSGEVDGDRVVITFTEVGVRRASKGKLVLHRESDEVLRGRFSSDAAQSTGVVEARR